jgi:hypothetical protein
MPTLSNSTFQTIYPPGSGVNVKPTVIARAVDAPLRALVDNIGPVIVYLAYTIGDVAAAEGPTPTTYQLLAGESRVFILAPKQQIFCVGATAGATLCIATSDAVVV